ncbi:MAG: extracellular solute-binding protein [Drouetiella hepatica Uher 2000/2452]|jgi:putative spermidine/putrescine transport system substrate-binding protein|uniref:Extracellular solute-binding protein n=1 Tax=Drouetiella hepatica Uher 2000/2452 TaxID=904376 RepID=A0A951UNY0_9CYAN|nr:extracellular solute-binding protein [Drouetiella hepatica Uher 2000/2452]
MLTRRSLLLGTSALALSQLVLGCNSTSDAALKIRVLENSVPPQLLKEFQRQAASLPLSFSQSKQLAELFELLQTWQTPQSDPKTVPIPGFVPFVGDKSVPPSDLVTLGDYWLAPAIQQKLIQPLPLQDIPEWQQLPEVWQQFARRDAQGNLGKANDSLWAAPYRWGTLMMVYRPDKFKSLGWTPSDWSDLWRSPLKGRISLPDSARAVIGLTLKKLGRSINLADLQSVANLPAELQLLQQQVKFYSSKSYLQPLILEDTWLAVGWSHEILPILKRDRELAGVVPQSGSVLTADLWVRPTTAPTISTGASDRLSLVKQWIGFCWQPQIATQLSLLSSAASPLFFGETAVGETAVGKTIASENLPESLRQARATIADGGIQQRSEFLLPLAPDTVEQYRRLWTTLRNTAVSSNA